jgi:hypothetical protein
VQVQFPAAFQEKVKQSNEALPVKGGPICIGTLKLAPDRFQCTKLNEAVKAYPLHQLASVVRSNDVAVGMHSLHPEALQEIGYRIVTQLNIAADAALMKEVRSTEKL